MYISAWKAMERQTPQKLWLKAISNAEQAPQRLEATSVRFLPSRSAAMPLGTSQRKPTTWNTASAMPTCAREKPLERRNTTHTPSAMRRENRKL